jgi:3-isopropylmalate dehydrogenase
VQPIVVRGSVRWTDAIRRGEAISPPREACRTVGVLPGEGIGPEVIGAALRVLSALESAGPCRFDVCHGGAIGREAELASGQPLTEEVAAFCGDVFADGGAILAGPGGGRFVYDLRKRFRLFCKLSPLRPWNALAHTGRVRPEFLDRVDVLLVRENLGGVYQGEWREAETPEGRVAEHAFRYSEPQVRRILEVAAALAAQRWGTLAVAVKTAGIPAVSTLWRELAEQACSRAGVRAACVDIDLLAYRLIQEPQTLDVLVAPNLFGDILADLGAVLLASRGLSFSGNFSDEGAAVYQTNHGAAHDLEGSDRANPIGQIASLALMLRESFGLGREAAWIEAAVEEVLGLGFRTFDVALPGAAPVGTAEMGERIAAAVERRARSSE